MNRGDAARFAPAIEVTKVGAPIFERARAAVAEYERVEIEVLMVGDRLGLIGHDGVFSLGLSGNVGTLLSAERKATIAQRLRGK